MTVAKLNDQALKCVTPSTELAVLRIRNCLFSYLHLASPLSVEKGTGFRELQMGGYLSNRYPLRAECPMLLKILKCVFRNL